MERAKPGLASGCGVPHKESVSRFLVLLSGVLFLVGSARVASAAGDGQRAADQHWAYRPVVAPSMGRSGGPGPVDALIDRAARGQGLVPAGPADRWTLGRRLHVVLTGLPPRPEVLRGFVEDPRPDAVERQVDALLASPGFGERWGRHWLDVVRFAESVTLRGLVYREAWRYRDYVLDAFNADLPFDRFVREQVAGGLLEAPDLESERRQKVASTFWLLGDTNLEEQDKRQLELDVIDEQLDVVGKAFLGQTIGCARCHDHKFDPIPARDYHAMAGILSGTRVLVHDNVSGWTEVPLPGTPKEEAEWAAAARAVQEAETRLRAARAGTNPVPTKAQLKPLEEALAEARRAAYRPMAMAPVESGATNLPVLRRGQWRHPGDVVPRGVLQTAFPAPTRVFHPEESGRRELAEWLVEPGHPLTARVYVNRVWHWVFGAGLVRSADNFGTTGDVPSHPELLDLLASDFIRDGWSVKRLVRRLVLTEAFQRSSDPRIPGVASSLEADPGNRWLARFSPRPVEAEVLRDTLLQVGDGLERGGRGAAGFPRTLSADYGFHDESFRRSLYLPQFRNARPDLAVVFDGADPSRVTGVRETSVIATQALFLMNDGFVRRQARAAAHRWTATPDPVGEAWLETVCRPPSTGERRRAEAHLRSGPDQEAALAELAQALFGTLDFRTLR